MPAVLRLVLCALVALSAAACSDRGRTEPPQDAAVQRYTVRGELLRVEGTGEGQQLWIRHEAIPDFVNQAGQKVGMNAMVMPFGVERGVKVDALTPGAKVRFQLAVDWGRNRFAVESVEPLPPDTALELGKSSHP